MKKLIMILGPLLLIGAVVGLGLMGIINIPGLTPKKDDWQSTLKKIYAKAHGTAKGDLVVLKDLPKEDTDAFVAAAKAGGLDPVAGPDGVKSAKLVAFLNKDAAKSAPAKPKTPPPAAEAKAPVKPKPAATINTDQGAETIAELWNSVDVAKLVKIIEKYKTVELAKIFLKMDADKVSELLAAVPPEKAAAFSLEIQKQASIVPAPTPAAGA